MNVKEKIKSILDVILEIRTCLEFIKNYIVWDELRLKPINFSASVQEQDKNDN